VSTGLLILRVVVGVLFIGHGTQKLFGWFGGHGLEGTGGFFEQLGYRPGKPHAALTGAVETTGGALLALGLFTPLAAAMLIGVMLNAIVSVHWPKVWSTDNGLEFPLVMATAAAALAFAGPGRVSIDAAMGGASWGVAWPLVALILGFASGSVLLTERGRELARERERGSVEDDAYAERRAA